ncbi:hypothetical protein M413DRAFT_448181 [Hebeloma cylindrosporum]|uniref:Protein kinase domain-containing protein n=1 Tax=Hebeloma cylindrosporum TaxID=76867 RepID=A0A0C3C0V8_HEBCY|nr:hypothetical protein M413DRAFT_448181 [Hebeloma cylindrosporum h7]
MFDDFSAFLETQRPDSPQPDLPSHFIDISTEIVSEGNEEALNFRFLADPCLSYPGKIVSVVYRRNKNEPVCAENAILDYDDDDDLLDKQHEALQALLKAIPDIETRSDFLYDTATCITIETIDGKLTASITEDVDAIISYFPIPLSLSHIPTISVTELKRIRPLHVYVDCVKWQGNTYAFKRSGEDNHHGSSMELTILDRLSKSPNIINLVAIVVNADNTILGFLTPFIRSGDLGNVFERARRGLGLGNEDDATAFEWPLKLSWARQITQAVVDLHSIQAYNGDLKPQNVLIDSTGQALLIDFHSKGISDEFAAPELLEMFYSSTHETITIPPSSDVYSLGLVLWAVAEERWRGMRPPVWREGILTTPDWYRDVVRRCLALSPEARPSVADVLALLESEGG